MKNGYYILKGKKAVFVKDVLEWEKWFEKADRIVKQETLKNGIRVSTVFLGLDHSFGEGEPLLFETMAFAKEEKTMKSGKSKFKYREELGQNRYSTWEEAEKGHKKMVKKWRRI